MMSQKAASFTRKRAAGAFALLATTALALGVPGAAWAVESNTSTVNSSSMSIPGTSSSSGGGIAVPGTATAISTPPIIVQSNVQVDTTGNPNNVQDATNDVTVDQATVAA